MTSVRRVRPRHARPRVRDHRVEQLRRHHSRIPLPKSVGFEICLLGLVHFGDCKFIVQGK